MKNPFEKMPTVLTADELIDKAFRRAEKAASAATPKGGPRAKAREREELRVRTVSNVVRDNLRKLLDRTPGGSQSCRPFTASWSIRSSIGTSSTAPLGG